MLSATRVLAEESVYIPEQKFNKTVLKKEITCKPYSSEYGYAFDVNSKPKYYDPAFQGYYTDNATFYGMSRYPAFYIPMVRTQYGKR